MMEPNPCTTELNPQTKVDPREGHPWKVLLWFFMLLERFKVQKKITTFIHFCSYTSGISHSSWFLSAVCCFVSVLLMFLFGPSLFGEFAFETLRHSGCWFWLFFWYCFPYVFVWSFSSWGFCFWDSLPWSVVLGFFWLLVALGLSLIVFRLRFVLVLFLPIFLLRIATMKLDSWFLSAVGHLGAVWSVFCFCFCSVLLFLVVDLIYHLCVRVGSPLILSWHVLHLFNLLASFFCTFYFIFVTFCLIGVNWWSKKTTVRHPDRPPYISSSFHNNIKHFIKNHIISSQPHT